MPLFDDPARAHYRPLDSTLMPIALPPEEAAATKITHEVNYMRGVGGDEAIFNNALGMMHRAPAAFQHQYRATLDAINRMRQALDKDQFWVPPPRTE